MQNNSSLESIIVYLNILNIKGIDFINRKANDPKQLMESTKSIFIIKIQG